MSKKLLTAMELGLKEEPEGMFPEPVSHLVREGTGKTIKSKAVGESLHFLIEWENEERTWEDYSDLEFLRYKR